MSADFPSFPDFLMNFRVKETDHDACNLKFAKNSASPDRLGCL